MTYLVPPEDQDHLRLPPATLPCLPEQCNHCGKNLSRKSRLSKHMSLKNTARKIPGQDDGTQKDQLCHLLNHLQDKDEL